MRIDRKTRDIKCIGQNDICRFSADTGKFDKLIHFGRNFPTVIRNEQLRRSDNIFCLDLITAAALDNFRHIGKLCLRQVTRRRVLREKHTGDLIDTDIRTLRRQDRGNQKFEGIFEKKRRLCANIDLFKPFHDLIFCFYADTFH